VRNRLAITFEEYTQLHPATKKTRNDPMFSEPQKQEARPTAPAQKQPAQVEEHRRNPSNNTVSGSPKVDHQISTYLNKMKEMVDKARAGGDKPPNFDLCEVSVPGTNLFCGGNRGIERKDMPQLKGKPADGTPASKLPVGADGEVSVEKPFVDALKSKGVKMQQKTVDASHLKSTQNQLVGSKVVGMIGALQKDPKNPDITAPIFVSKDGYVLDGHHRWAAVVGLNFFTDKPVNMNVIEVDMGIDDLVNFTNQFADQMGIRQKAARLRLIAASLKEAGNNEPTNPSLWDKVQKLTKGEMKSLTHGGKTVDGPNDGKGFKIFPSAYANGWASKTYKDLGGGWKKKKTAGGNTFFTVSSGSTARDAFENARSMALGEYESEYGEYEGYSGTIAEKNNFVMIDLPKGEDAYKYAEKLIDDGDRRIDDKWGPAGCIKLSAGKFLFFGWASS
jgi:hypothetical protein